jgi:hypothetical protein
VKEKDQLCCLDNWYGGQYSKHDLIICKSVSPFQLFVTCLYILQWNALSCSQKTFQYVMLGFLLSIRLCITCILSSTIFHLMFPSSYIHITLQLCLSSINRNIELGINLRIIGRQHLSFFFKGTCDLLKVPYNNRAHNYRPIYCKEQQKWVLWQCNKDDRASSYEWFVAVPVVREKIKLSFLQVLQLEANWLFFFIQNIPNIPNIKYLHISNLVWSFQMEITCPCNKKHDMVSMAFHYLAIMTIYDA